MLAFNAEAEATASATFQSEYSFGFLSHGTFYSSAALLEEVWGVGRYAFGGSPGTVLGMLPFAK